MRQITVDTVVSAPREQVFDLVADLSLRPAWCDHFLAHFRLARANPVGKGAAARFRFDRSKLRGEWAEISVAEFDRPRRIVEEGRVGRRGRSRMVAVYEFIPEGPATRVEVTMLSEPGTIGDRVKQSGAHRWMRRQTKTALGRLRQILEEPPEGELRRVTVAGYDDSKAPRFGAHPTARRELAPSDG